MVTVHLIPHAHIDPIWLWPWTAGLDEAIATCRTACDLLDRHPDLTFNLGDAWVLQQVEQTDPETFARIRALVAADRWDLSGGWYIQPDCNFPLSESLRKQIEIGLKYMRERFGRGPEIAMNVDSFGHAGSLPTLLREAGQHSYVMMRPQEHEMKLPARLFRWRDPATDQVVTAFRIASSYTTPVRIDLEHIKASLTELPPGVRDTMCFVGVGDHGGGPTEAMLEWCREHRRALDGVRLEFSTPPRFFAAIRDVIGKLPTVSSELQMHAIGCYSVAAHVKRAVRRAERLLIQAERCHRLDPAPSPDAGERLEEAWRSVCFQQFHDTAGGTCIPSSYAHVLDDIGGAAAAAERRIAQALRRLMLQRLGDDPLQRIVLLNPSSHPYDDYVECEPWCEFTPWQPSWGLLDADGSDVPYQVIGGEANHPEIRRVLFRVRLEPDELRQVRIDRGGHRRSEPPRGAWAERGRLRNDQGLVIRHDDRAVEELCFGSSLPALAAPRLVLIEDPSDTWSHGIDRYAAGPQVLAQWNAFTVVELGPLMSSCIQEGRIGDSPVWAEWRLYAGMPYVDLRLRIEWAERHKVLKLLWPTAASSTSRLDGTLGGSSERPIDGREYPIQDWILLHHAHGDQAVVCPDTFAADVDAGKLRLTLLRSPVMAHHDPHPPVSPRRRYSDRGEHTLAFRFLFGKELTPAAVARHAHHMHQPLVLADLTRGMPGRRVRGETG